MLEKWRELCGVKPGPLYLKKWNEQELPRGRRCSFKCSCEENREDVKNLSVLVFVC